ncbi:MAG: hypothetical protein KJO38_02385, partial [Gammaproteobacteria bacterium]|nr:hypothetical protein [Gammaproteobacteria bacterium]
GRHGVWIDLEGGLTVKVDTPDVDNFPRGFFDRLDGRSVEARGWIYSTDKGLRIKAHHPVELALVPGP